MYHPTNGKPRPGERKILFHEYAAKLINPEDPPFLSKFVLWHRTTKLGSARRSLTDLTTVFSYSNFSTKMSSSHSDIFVERKNVFHMCESNIFSSQKPETQREFRVNFPTLLYPGRALISYPWSLLDESERQHEHVP